MKVLVTGGAGYVGGTTVRALLAAGEEVVVLDDLSTGHADSVPAGVPLVVQDLKDRPGVRAVLRGATFDAVLHFAASAYVGESVTDPRKYWENNVGATMHLLSAALDAGIRRFVFSSTCAVYGQPPVTSLTEDLPRAPVNPYGRSKAVVEQILEDYAAAYGFRSFRLRYFNAAGAVSDLSHGERHEPETHLIPLALEAVRSGRPLRVFGTDWDTPDGTCVRDYVHVEDLAAAHVAALRALRSGHPGAAVNLGTGRGASVKEVIDACARVTGQAVPWEAAPRRAGDPAYLVAAPGRAAADLGWVPVRSGLDDIVTGAWRWLRR